MNDSKLLFHSEIKMNKKMNDYIELFKYKVKGVQGMNTEVNLKLYYTRKRKKEKDKLNSQQFTTKLY